MIQRQNNNPSSLRMGSYKYTTSLHVVEFNCEISQSNKLSDYCTCRSRPLTCYLISRYLITFSRRQAYSAESEWFILLWMDIFLHHSWLCLFALSPIVLLLPCRHELRSELAQVSASSLVSIRWASFAGIGSELRRKQMSFKIKFKKKRQMCVS